MSNKNSTQRIQEIYDLVSGIKEAVGTETPAPEDPEDSEGEQGKAQGKAQSTTDEQSRWRNAVWTAVLISFGIVLFFAALAQWLLPSLLPVNPAPEVFRDPLKSDGEGPQMVVLPTGSFRMGSPSGETDRVSAEGPVRTVTIGKRIAMGRYEVTFAEYNRFAEATSRTKPYDWDWGRGTRPVTDVSQTDAKAYATWLSAQTGKTYRLPSESEWEYAARAGTETAYSWGNEIGVNRANCDGCGSEWDGEQTAPVGRFAANAFGLFDMHGNVWEWVEDCWHDNYKGAPTDGSAWTTNCDDSGWAVVRGGSWFDGPWDLRSAARGRFRPSDRDFDVGFRLVQDLNP